MIQSVIRYIKGYVRIRVSGYSPERFINACRYRKIRLWGLFPHKGAYEMYTTIQGFKKLKPIIRKTGTKVTIIGRFGLPFFLHRYRRRKMFFIGAIGCGLFIYAMSLFVWEIEVTGNISRSDETLLEFLGENDVRHGMLISNIDCTRIVKDLRKQYDDIIWASASIRGTRLVIQVKENETLEQERTFAQASQSEEAEVSEETSVDIIADQDCVITEIITRKGTPLVKAGDVVKKGDVLVSGLVAVINDSQEVIGYKAQHSQADIRGQITSIYEDKQERTYEEKNYVDQVKEESYLRIQDYVFWLGSKKNRFQKSEMLLKETQICIGNHFTIPVFIGHRTTRPYQSRETEYSQKVIQQRLSSRFAKTQAELEKKGVEIIENSVKIYNESDFAVAKGTLTMICSIGEERESTVPDVSSVEDNVDGND